MTLTFLRGALAILVCLSSTPSALGDVNEMHDVYDVYKSERELRQDLFCSYDKLVRPVKKSSTTVPVKVSLSLIALRSMNEKEQVITLETWLKMQWTDEYLQWDPSEYNNITELRVQPSEVWLPDLALYTGTPDTSQFPVIQTQVVVYNTGSIYWVPPFTISSRCPFPARNSDVSKTFIDCNIRLGSWASNGDLMDLHLASEKVDLTNFEDFNRDWKLVKIVSNRQSKFYPCCPEEYPHLNFNITLKRRN